MAEYLPPVDFGKLEINTPYLFEKISDEVRETSDGRSWNTHVMREGIAYNMFMNQKNKNHQYLHQEMMKLRAGDQFYFTKIETVEGMHYFITLEEPNVEKLHKIAVNDKSLTRDDRAFMSAAAMMSFGAKDPKVLIEKYHQIVNLFPKNQHLNVDQINILFMSACLFSQGTVEDMMDGYKSLSDSFLFE